MRRNFYRALLLRENAIIGMLWRGVSWQQTAANGARELELRWSTALPAGRRRAGASTVDGTIERRARAQNTFSVYFEKSEAFVWSRGRARPFAKSSHTRGSCSLWHVATQKKRSSGVWQMSPRVASQQCSARLSNDSTDSALTQQSCAKNDLIFENQKQFQFSVSPRHAEPPPPPPASDHHDVMW